MQKLNVEKVRLVSTQIQPMLVGLGSAVQSAVLADLMSLWLAGQWPQELRDVLLERWVEMVEALVPLSEEQLFGPGGHPAGRQ